MKILQPGRANHLQKPTPMYYLFSGVYWFPVFYCFFDFTVFKTVDLDFLGIRQFSGKLMYQTDYMYFPRQI